MADGTTPVTTCPSCVTNATILSCAFWCKVGSRTIPPFPTSERCNSNCGLIRVRITPVEVIKSNAFGRTRVNEMKETSITQMSTSSGICSRESERALTFFENNHPWIVAELPIQLTLADIHRINLTGATLQHAVGKAAG